MVFFASLILITVKWIFMNTALKCNTSYNVLVWLVAAKVLFGFGRRIYHLNRQHWGFITGAHSVTIVKVTGYTLTFEEMYLQSTLKDYPCSNHLYHILSCNGNRASHQLKYGLKIQDKTHKSHKLQLCYFTDEIHFGHHKCYTWPSSDILDWLNRYQKCWETHMWLKGLFSGHSKLCKKILTNLSLKQSCHKPCNIKNFNWLLIDKEKQE